MKKIILSKENIEEVIGKQMDKIATPAEIEALHFWRGASEENESYYQHVLKINGWYTDLHSQLVDVDSAWLKVQQSIQKEENNNGESREIALWRNIGYAASFFLVLGMLWYFASSDSLIDKRDEVTKYAATHSSMDYTLEDGSTVHLSKNSALSKRSDSNRSFGFSGSARFEVVHDEKDPFTVHMEDIIVKDLGTVFDIESKPLSDTIFVKVLEGVVQFFTIDNDGILVEEGEEGMYIKSRNLFFKRSIDKYNSYLSIIFNDATLGDVTDHLAYSFRKRIKFQNDSIKRCNISVDFSKASFSEVKEIIEETLGLTIESRDNLLVVDGKGCK